MDDLDVALLRLFSAEPRIGVLEASRRLGVARGTVQSRLDRLTERGILAGWAPTLDPAALGYPVTAFLTLQLRQGIGHDVVAAHLEGIAEVTEAHTITGEGDMWVRVVARFPADSHPPIRYPAAVIAASQSPDATPFLAFLESAEARRIFARHGFTTPE